MSRPENTGAMANGGTYRITAYALEILSPAGELQEELDLQKLRDVGRDGHAVSIRLEDGRTRVLDAATIDDAGRLQEALRRHVPPAPIRPATPPPPTTSQSVNVSGGSGSPIVGVIVGIAVLILVIFLIIIVVNALDDDDDNDDATPAPGQTEEPAVPTDAEPEDPTEPEAESSPTESATVLPLHQFDPGDDELVAMVDSSDAAWTRRSSLT